MAPQRQLFRRPLTDYDWRTIARNLSRAAVIHTWRRARLVLAYLLLAPLCASLVVLAGCAAVVYAIFEALHIVTTGRMFWRELFAGR